MTQGIRQFVTLKPNTQYTISAYVSSLAAPANAPVANPLNVSFAGPGTNVAASVFENSGGQIASITASGLPDFTIGFNTSLQQITIAPVNTTFVGTDGSGAYTITDTAGQTSPPVSFSITRTSTTAATTNIFTVFSPEIPLTDAAPNFTTTGSLHQGDQVTMNWVGGTTHSNVYFDPNSFSANIASATTICNFILANIEAAYATIKGWFNGHDPAGNQPSPTAQDPSGVKFNVLLFRNINGGSGGFHGTQDVSTGAAFGDLYIGTNSTFFTGASMWATIAELVECFELNFATTHDSGTGFASPWYPGDALGEAVSVLGANETTPGWTTLKSNAWLNQIDPSFNVARHDYSADGRGFDYDTVHVGFGTMFLYWLRVVKGVSFTNIIMAGDVTYNQMLVNLSIANTFADDVNILFPLGKQYPLLSFSPDHPDNPWPLNNLVKNCKNFGATTWAIIPPTAGFIKSPLVTDPFGGTTAQEISFSSTVRAGYTQVIPALAASTTYNASIFFKQPATGTTTPIYLAYYNGSTAISQIAGPFTGGASWVRSGFNFTTGASDPNPTFVIVNTNTDLGTGTSGAVQIWGAKVEPGTTESEFDGCAINPNLVVDPSDYTTTNWVRIGTTAIAATKVLAPDGTTSAEVVTFPTARSGYSQVIPSLLGNNTYVATVHYKAPASGAVTPFYLGYYDGSTPIAQFSVLLTGTSLWSRSIDFKFVTGSVITASSIVIINANSDTGTGIAGSVEIWGLKVEQDIFSTEFVPGAATGPVVAGGSALNYMVGYIDKDSGGSNANSISSWLGRPLDIVGTTIVFTNVPKYPSQYLVAAAVPLTDLYANTGESSMTAAAAGTYDYRYQNMANGCLNNGNSGGGKTAVARIGWEMNFGWPWGGNASLFIQAFKRCAAIFKKTMPHVMIEWCPNIAFGNNQYGKGNPQDYWVGTYDPINNPGGCDVVAMDFYRQNIGGGSSFNTAVTFGGSTGYNLAWLVNWANTHNTLVGLSEWGDGQNANDSQYTLDAAAWMNNQGAKFAYTIWSQYSPADQLVTSGSFPNEQTGWKQAWGPPHSFGGSWWKG